MTETEFIKKALELAKKGSLHIFMQESWQADFVKRMLFINACFTVADAEFGVPKLPSDIRKLTKSAAELKELNVVFDSEFLIKEFRVRLLNADYVLDVRDYLPFEIPKIFPPITLGKQ